MWGSFQLADSHAGQLRSVGLLLVRFCIRGACLLISSICARPFDRALHLVPRQRPQRRDHGLELAAMLALMLGQLRGDLAQRQPPARLVLAAALPLAFLLWHRNLRPASSLAALRRRLAGGLMRA